MSASERESLEAIGRELGIDRLEERGVNNLRDLVRHLEAGLYRRQMMRVRIKLDFVLEINSDRLPHVRILDFIEQGTRTLDVETVAIAPGAKVAVSRAGKRKAKTP